MHNYSTILCTYKCLDENFLLNFFFDLANVDQGKFHSGNVVPVKCRTVKTHRDNSCSHFVQFLRVFENNGLDVNGVNVWKEDYSKLIFFLKSIVLRENYSHKNVLLIIVKLTWLHNVIQCKHVAVEWFNVCVCMPYFNFKVTNNKNNY